MVNGKAYFLYSLAVQAGAVHPQICQVLMVCSPASALININLSPESFIIFASFEQWNSAEVRQIENNLRSIQIKDSSCCKVFPISH